MAFRDRIEVVVDFVTTPAKKGMTSLKADVAAADGVMGKFKAGTKGAFDQLSVYGPQAALAAGAALVAFGTKSVKAFQDSALAAGEFSDRTGTSVEDASRWIAVGDDFGIAGEAIQTAFQRMNLAIAGNKLEQFGLDVVRAADGTVDANATFLQTATEIGKIPDAAERAKAAQAVFGKSWGEISRLMQMDAEDLTKALAAVSDAQVIDDQELTKAKRLQAAMDELGDAVLDVQLAVGEALVPAVADAAEKITDMKAAAENLGDGLGKIPLSGFVDDMIDFALPIDEIVQGLSAVTEKGDTWGQRLGNVGKMIPFVGEAIDRLGDKFGWYGETLDASGPMWDKLIADTKATKDETGDLGDEFDDATSAATPYVSKIEALADRLAAVKTAEEELRDSRKTAAEANIALEDATDGYQDSLGNLYGVLGDVKSTTEDVETANRDARDAAIDMAEAYADQQIAAGSAKTANDLQIESLGFLASTLAPDSPLRKQLENYIADLKGIPTTVQTNVSVTYLNNGNGPTVDENGNVHASRRAGGAGTPNALGDSALWAQAMSADLAGNATKPSGPSAQERQQAGALERVRVAEAQYKLSSKAARKSTARRFLAVLLDARKKFDAWSVTWVTLTEKIRGVRADLAEMDKGDTDAHSGDGGNGGHGTGMGGRSAGGVAGRSAGGGVSITLNAPHAKVIHPRFFDEFAENIDQALRRYERGQG